MSIMLVRTDTHKDSFDDIKKSLCHSAPYRCRGFMGLENNRGSGCFSIREDRWDVYVSWFLCTFCNSEKKQERQEPTLNDKKQHDTGRIVSQHDQGR